MAWKLHENSLFAVLLRARWWASGLVGLGVFVPVQLLLDAGFAFYASLPFFVICAVVLWRQMRTPSGRRLEAAIDRLRAMPWNEFAAVLEEAFRREGFTVRRTEGAAELELERGGQVSLVGARRWKAALTGIEPLKELASAGEKRGAGECLYVCAGEMTPKAAAFASANRIRLLAGAELAKLIAGGR